MKLSKTDWLNRGIDVLTQFGPEQLKVERLCKHLGVTKGSFYHHFQNRADYVSCLLEHWHDTNTRAIIEQVNQQSSAEARSDALDLISMQTDTGPERAIRGWGQYDSQVAAKIEEVDQQRLAYLDQLIAQQIPDASQSELIAKIAYAHFVGSQQLSGLISSEDWQQMNQLLRTVFTASDQEKDFN